MTAKTMTPEQALKWLEEMRGTVSDALGDAEKLRELAAHYDVLGVKPNGDYLREVANRIVSLLRREAHLAMTDHQTTRTPGCCDRRLAVDDLIKRLRAVKWEEVYDDDRMPDDPAHKCVLVDMRPDDFRALLREVVGALERRSSSARS